MNKIPIIALGALALGVALTGAPPAKAAVAVSVGVAAPAEECIAYRKHHTLRFAYCDEPVYVGEPVVIEGVTYRENLHFRMHRGHREFWIRGRWRRHD